MHLLNSSSFFILNLSLSLTSWSTSQLEKSKFDVEIQEAKWTTTLLFQARKTKINCESVKLTSINLEISCTFSLFLSLKASRASLYSFSCDEQKSNIQASAQISEITCIMNEPKKQTVTF